MVVPQQHGAWVNPEAAKNKPDLVNLPSVDDEDKAEDLPSPPPTHPPSGQFGSGPDITAVSSASVVPPSMPPLPSMPPTHHSNDGNEEPGYAVDPDVAVRAPDILRNEHVVIPSSDRNLFMRTGHLDEQDELREQQQQQMVRYRVSLLEQNIYLLEASSL